MSKLVRKVLGPDRYKAILARSLRKHGKKEQFTFPIDRAIVHEMLCILPHDPIETVHQLGTILSLVKEFNRANVSLLCERSIAPIVKNIPDLEVVEYDAALFTFDSPQFKTLQQQFRKDIDLCILLDRNPPLHLLYFAGATGATIRAGYTCAGEDPFLNLRIKPSEHYAFLGDWNHSLARSLGSVPPKNIRWSVSKAAVEEMNHVLKEFHLNPQNGLVGVDLIALIRCFGIEWSQKMLQQLRERCNEAVLIFSQDTPNQKESELFQTIGLPVLTGYVLSKAAAFVTCSSAIITTNTVLFAISGLLDKKVIGIIQKSDASWYCNPYASKLMTIQYEEKADDSTIKAVIAALCTQNG